MEYLLLAVIIILTYAEFLPTISLACEYIRTWIAYGIALIQQRTVAQQEEIQKVQERLQPQQSNAIGFQYVAESEEEDEDYE